MHYYDIQGATREELHEAMRNGPARMPGDTHWYLAYEYSPRMKGGRCVVESVQTRLDVTMTLPRWTPPQAVNASLVRSWKRASAALRKHEEGHVSIARRYEKTIAKALRLVSAADCDALQPALHDLYRELMGEMRAAQRAYDERTQHGIRQGTWF